MMNDILFNKCKFIFLFMGLVLLITHFGCKHNSTTEYNSEGRRYNDHIKSLDMNPVGGGTFFMGSNDTTAFLNEYPGHAVTLDSFFIQREEVGYSEYEGIRQMMRSFGYSDLGKGGNYSFPENANYAVTMLSWHDCVKWCNAWSQMSGLEPVYYTDSMFTTVYKTGMIDQDSLFVKWTATGYRLPTEAEWEFAARGGMKTHSYTYSGSNSINEVARYAQNPGNDRTSPPLIPNELGLYNMSGNVWEWCWDRYGPYADAPQKHPKGALSGSLRVMRGGSYSSSSSECRVTFRRALDPRCSYTNVGFRVVQRGCVY